MATNKRLADQARTREKNTRVIELAEGLSAFLDERNSHLETISTLKKELSMMRDQLSRAKTELGRFLRADAKATVPMTQADLEYLFSNRVKAEFKSDAFGRNLIFLKPLGKPQVTYHGRELRMALLKLQGRKPEPASAPEKRRKRDAS